MRRRPPRSKRTDTRFPYTTLFRFRQSGADAGANGQISDRFIPLSRAEPVFSQRGGVDVCVYRDRSVKRLPQCLDEIAACPSGLCRFELLAEAWIRGIENKR